MKEEQNYQFVLSLENQRACHIWKKVIECKHLFKVNFVKKYLMLKSLKIIRF